MNRQRIFINNITKRCITGFLYISLGILSSAVFAEAVLAEDIAIAEEKASTLSETEQQLSSTKNSTSAPMTQLSQIQANWAQATFKSHNDDEKRTALLKVLEQADAYLDANQNNAEALTWSAIALSSYAGADRGFKSLSLLRAALDNLLQAETIDPMAANGSVYNSLAVLYSQAPGWPLSFGSDKKAKLYFDKALKATPQGLETNLFYAQFLIGQKQLEMALVHLQNALDAPVMLNMPVTDAARRSEAAALLAELTASS